MTTDVVFIPFSKDLYDDLVRFSDGEMDVPSWAEEQILDYLERNIGAATSQLFGSRAKEFYEKYAPDYAKEVADRLERAEELEMMELLEKSLVWKEIEIASGTKVRMQYGGAHHFAIVRDGKIEDDSGRYSPSQWAMKVANGTSRNAWRDIEFRDSFATHWKSAELLRSRARAEARSADDAKD